MDFDLFPIVPEGSGRRDRRPNEDAASVIAIAVIPILYAMLLAASEQLYETPRLSLVAMPLLLGGLAAVICRALRVRTGRGVSYSAGCAGMCALMVGVILVLDVMIFPF